MCLISASSFIVTVFTHLKGCESMQLLFPSINSRVLQFSSHVTTLTNIVWLPGFSPFVFVPTYSAGSALPRCCARESLFVFSIVTLHRPQIVRDAGAVAHIIEQRSSPCPSMYATTAAVEFDYREMHIAKVPFYIYFTRPRFNYKLQSVVIWCQNNTIFFCRFCT